MEQIIVREIGRNTHTGLADRFLARLSAVRAHYADPDNHQMPSEAYCDGTFLGYKASYRFYPTREGDHLTIIAGPLTVIAINSGNGYIVRPTNNAESAALAA
jgi:hypothetical protein